MNAIKASITVNSIPKVPIIVAKLIIRCTVFIAVPDSNARASMITEMTNANGFLKPANFVNISKNIAKNINNRTTSIIISFVCETWNKEYKFIKRKKEKDYLNLLFLFILILLQLALKSFHLLLLSSLF